MGSSIPEVWAQDKKSKAKRYAVGEVADAIRKGGYVLSNGVPVSAWIGVCCNGGRNENTTGWIKCDEDEKVAAAKSGKTPLGRDYSPTGDAYPNHGLHELGPLGVEAGNAPGLVAPSGSPWAEGAVSEGVRKVLGREGITTIGGWHGAVTDQLVIGMWNNVRHGRGVRAKLDPRLQWPVSDKGNPKSWGMWAFACATMGWSAGDSGAARHINRYADQLANVPEVLRWGAFVRLAATYDGGGRKHSRPSYSALRTCQKIAAGRLAAVELKESLAWFADGLDMGRESLMRSLVVSAVDG